MTLSRGLSLGDPTLTLAPALLRWEKALLAQI